MAAPARFTFRDVVESGYILVVLSAPGPDGVGVVVWDGSRHFIVWFTFDGREWERLGSFHYPADDWRDAQEWSAHRLSLLFVEYQA